MQKVTVVFGPMGVGKTTYAKQISESKGLELLRFDEWFSDRFNGEFEPFLEWLILKASSSDHGLIIDGWFVWEESEVKSNERLTAKIPVEWICLFAPRWVVEDRYKNRINKDVDAGLELSFKRTMSTIPENCKFIDATDFNYEECTKKEYERRVDESVYADEIKSLMSEMQSHENYQNMQLPFGLSNNGYRDCEDSWRQIECLVDWKGKTVLDVGCHWGYFCHEIKSKGAAEVVGSDASYKALKIAKEARRLKKSAVVFKLHDIDEEDINREYDVIFMLNTLHHLRHPFHALARIFKKAHTAIFEIELPWNTSLRDKPIVEMGDPIKLSSGKMGGHLRFSKEMMIRVAAENGHALRKEVPSFRPNRTILMFQRD